jgi:hypothetical protein
VYSNHGLAREPVDCKFGAPMGRPGITENPEARVRLFRVQLPEGYDRGGAYWGIGPPSLYCAWGDGFRVFVRAYAPEEAKSKLLREFPTLKFVTRP